MVDSIIVHISQFPSHTKPLFLSSELPVFLFNKASPICSTTQQRSNPSSSRVSGFILPPVNAQKSVFSSTASSVLSIPAHAAYVL